MSSAIWFSSESKEMKQFKSKFSQNQVHSCFPLEWGLRIGCEWSLYFFILMLNIRTCTRVAEIKDIYYSWGETESRQPACRMLIWLCVWLWRSAQECESVSQGMGRARGLELMTSWFFSLLFTTASSTLKWLLFRRICSSQLRRESQTHKNQVHNFKAVPVFVPLFLIEKHSQASRQHLTRVG